MVLRCNNGATSDGPCLPARPAGSEAGAVGHHGARSCVTGVATGGEGERGPAACDLPPRCRRRRPPASTGPVADRASGEVLPCRRLACRGTATSCPRPGERRLPRTVRAGAKGGVFPTWCHRVEAGRSHRHGVSGAGSGTPVSATAASHDPGQGPVSALVQNSRAEVKLAPGMAMGFANAAPRRSR